MTILDIGCGLNKEPNTIGVDIYPLSTVDVVHDLNKVPWPFETSSIDKIIFKHSLNHLDNLVQVMDEVYRICKNNASITIIAPHFSSDNMFTDPTMKFFLSIRSMDYFVKSDSAIFKNYSYYGNARFVIEKKYIYFYKSSVVKISEKLMSIFSRPLDILFNIVPRFYEKYIAFIIRANELKFVLRVIK